MSEASSSPRSVSSSAPHLPLGLEAASTMGTRRSQYLCDGPTANTAADRRGRPVLFGNEVEIYSEEHIDVAPTWPLLGHHTPPLLHGRDEFSSRGVLLAAGVDHAHHKGGGLLATLREGAVDITTRPQPQATSFLKLSFKDGGRDDFFNPLQASLKRKAWKDTQPSHLADRRLVKRQFNAADAGIAGIMRRQQEAQKETTELAATAFSDLANLMLKARDMVSLIERYVDTQKAVESTGEDGTTTSREDDINKLSSLMLDMGITSPVTRENSGAAYYEQLARQLAEYLSGHMPKNGGIMTLSDIYCMFNRARGVELVSPDDLYHAALLQKKLKLGYSVRKFPGGLIVLQTDSHREDKVAVRLAMMAQKSSSGYITSTDVSVEMHTSFPLAWEYLKVQRSLENSVETKRLREPTSIPISLSNLRKTLT
ncbi:Vacuolar protein sorting protein 36, GLUE domain [Phytophthora cactorum]|nr:Vacuolar protein sorting protein 36, GLUE domain [Phytophthora cactorum]